MQSPNKKLVAIEGFRFTAKAARGLALLITSCTRPSFPQTAGQQTFPSADAASQALFRATQSGNEQAVEHILGRGKELVSSGDEAQDNLDREQFSDKYQQMHRLVRETDGTTLLYIGAENWPFPVPLVSRANVWYFDSKSGAQEVRFRRLGENEYTAIETCQALVEASEKPGKTTTEVDPVTQYASTIINAQRTQIGSNSSNGDRLAGPFHGYYFRILSAQLKAKSGHNSASVGFTAVAYPADYRSSGVMTFLVTDTDVVYERDLGPSTAAVVKAMTTWGRTSKWHVVE